MCSTILMVKLNLPKINMSILKSLAAIFFYFIVEGIIRELIKQRFVRFLGILLNEILFERFQEKNSAS